MQDSEFLQLIRDVLGLREKLDKARFSALASPPAHLRLALREELHRLQNEVVLVLASLS